MINETEETFVRTFIARDRRDRWLSFLPSEKNRGKLLRRLAHSLEVDLDARFVFDKDEPPPDVNAEVQKVLAGWKKANPKQLCYIITNGPDAKDGQMMNLTEAEESLGLTYGSIIHRYSEQTGLLSPGARQHQQTALQAAVSSINQQRRI